MDDFEAARREVVRRVAARLAEAIRKGEGDIIDLSCQLLRSRRRQL